MVSLNPSASIFDYFRSFVFRCGKSLSARDNNVEERAEDKQWELRLERARYQAKRAERQYQAVEPQKRVNFNLLEY